jgi:hypothetical protein
MYLWLLLVSSFYFLSFLACYEKAGTSGNPKCYAVDPLIIGTCSRVFVHLHPSRDIVKVPGQSRLKRFLGRQFGLRRFTFMSIIAKIIFFRRPRNVCMLYLSDARSYRARWVELGVGVLSASLSTPQRPLKRHTGGRAEKSFGGSYRPAKLKTYIGMLICCLHQVRSCEVIWSNGYKGDLSYEWVRALGWPF